jgi:serine/threonine-protein kinase RsbT
MHPGLVGTVRIISETDIVAIRKAVREEATTLGFGVTDVTRIVTAASELARNVFHFAYSGVMQLRTFASNGNIGIELTFIDEGPGIPDIAKAMEVGYASKGGLGLGLPGTKRLMDEMDIQSEPDKGTTVTIKKWMKKINEINR